MNENEIKAERWDEFVKWFKKEWEEVNKADTTLDLRTLKGRDIEARHNYLEYLRNKFPDLDKAVSEL